MTTPPRAEWVPAPRFTVLWLLPLAALLLAVVLGWQAWGRRGPLIQLRFAEGHGLKAGDSVRHLGIVVGRVADLRLRADRGGVEVEVQLDAGARSLAAVGSRFWIVRPHFGLDAVEGLDTLVGDRYVGVLSGDGPAQHEFEGLSQAPVPDSLAPGLDVTLEGRGRGSLRPGSPVTYRGIEVGSVITVGLASDGRTVEAGVRIRQGYVGLVREGTRFWDSGGLDLDLGLGGVSLRVDTLQHLLMGGVALAVPDDHGAPASTGTRFELHAALDPDWLEWRPALPVGHGLLPPGVPLPRPLRAVLVWTEGRLFRGEERREGFALVLPGALLLPADLVEPPEGFHAGSARLECDGRSLDPTGESSRPAPGLALLSLADSGATRPWPKERQARAEGPQDCLAIADPAGEPLSLAAGRFRAAEDGWHLDGALPLDERWHGAAVLSRTDGRLLGLLLMDDAGRRVALLPGPLP